MVLIGAVIVMGIRFATYKPDDVHYHANFALFINGQRQEFKSPEYYTEVEMCTLSTTIVPQQRAHMHDNVNNVIHVEDHAVTWGQFFANMRYIMGPTFLSTRDGTVYSEDASNKLNLVLNGQDYTDLGGLENTVINDKDKLLVSYGNFGAKTLMKQYNTIPSTAARYDVTKDPKSCSGHGHSGLRDRLMHVL